MNTLHTLLRGTDKPENGVRYTDAREHYLERSARDRREAITMRRAVIAQSIVICVLVLTLAFVCVQPRLQPVYFAEDKLGTLHAVGSDFGSTTPDARAVEAELVQWLIDARSVTSDPLATAQRMKHVAALVESGSPAETFLGQWYKEHDPAALGERERIAVSVSSATPVRDSSSEYIATWTEQAYDRSGNQIGAPALYRAVFNVLINPSAAGDREAIALNPAGVYIEQMDWARQG